MFTLNLKPVQSSDGQQASSRSHLLEGWLAYVHPPFARHISTHAIPSHLMLACHPVMHAIYPSCSLFSVPTYAFPVSMVQEQNGKHIAQNVPDDVGSSHSCTISMALFWVQGIVYQ